MSSTKYFEYPLIFSFFIINFIFFKKNKLNVLFFDTLITSTTFTLYKYSVANKIKRMDLHYNSPLIKFINQFISCFVISYLSLLVLFILLIFILKVTSPFFNKLKFTNEKFFLFIKLLFLIVFIVFQWYFTFYRINTF